MTVTKLGFLTNSEAGLIYSKDGHTHADLATGIAAGVTAMQAHDAVYVHWDREVIEVPVAFVNTALEVITIPFVINITGYIVKITAKCRAAPSGSAVSFTLSAASTWGGTPGATTTVQIAAGANTGEQTVITDAGVLQGGMGLIAVTPDSGGTCRDARVIVEMISGNVIPQDPVLLGRYLDVSWVFPVEEEDTITHFAIYKDGVEVYASPNAATRTATMWFAWDSEYSIAACNGEVCSDLAKQIVSVFAPALTNGQAATASSEGFSGGVLQPATNAVDGRASTSWFSGTGQTQWLMSPLKNNAGIAGYRVKFGATSYGIAWAFQLSANGIDWTTVHTVTANEDQVIIINGLTAASAAYARLAFTASATSNYVVGEFEVIPS